MILETAPYKLSTTEDFEYFKREAESMDGWHECYKNEMCQVWTKSNEKSTIHVTRAHAVFRKLSPEILYDTLHDAEYRADWDDKMIEGKVIEQLDSFNEVGYYSAKAPFGIANRDFVNLRSWRADADKGEWLIFNHSVTHKDMPEKKDFVRARSILTGYYVKKTEEGCTLTYITQSDPRGWIPNMIVNTLTTKFAPTILNNMYNAALNYPEWKAKHHPDKKPWLGTKS